MQITKEYSSTDLKMINSYPSKNYLAASEKIGLIISDYNKLCAWIMDSLVGYFTNSELDFIRFSTQGVDFTTNMNPLYKLVFMLDHSLKNRPYDNPPTNIISKVQKLSPEQCYVLLILGADSWYGAGDKIKLLYSDTKKE